MSLAIMFAGQGAQFVGMGKELYQVARCRRVFDEADEVLGFSITGLMFEGEERELGLTENTQPALLTHSIAAWELIRQEFARPGFLLGLSLGEYSALVAAGALGFADALRLVRRRGQLMQQACPEGVGAMSAIFGLGRDAVVKACSQAEHMGVIGPANYNMPGQVVIAGVVAALEEAEACCVRLGAKRCIRLKTSGAFHTALMESAGQALGLELAELEARGLVGEMRIPVVSNFDARPIKSSAFVAQTLVRQVSSPVMWEDSIKFLIDEGVKTFIEVGPGNTCSGFVKKIAAAAEGSSENFKIKSYSEV